VTRESATAVVLVIAATVLGATERSQRPTFAARVESVRVDALVTENGQPVPGLGPADFEVFDNGVRQDVDLVSFEQVPLDVVLVLDMSDSVAGERLDHLRSASDAVLGGLAGEDRAALVTFNHAVSLGTPLTKDVAAVRSALNLAQGNGQTALVDGVYAAMIMGESETSRAPAGLLRRSRHRHLADVRRRSRCGEARRHRRLRDCDRGWCIAVPARP
jgi:VWFA-related protein